MIRGLMQSERLKEKLACSRDQNEVLDVFISA